MYINDFENLQKLLYDFLKNITFWKYVHIRSVFCLVSHFDWFEYRSGSYIENVIHVFLMLLYRLRILYIVKQWAIEVMSTFRNEIKNAYPMASKEIKVAGCNIGTHVCNSVVSVYTKYVSSCHNNHVLLEVLESE